MDSSFLCIVVYLQITYQETPQASLSSVEVIQLWWRTNKFLYDAVESYVENENIDQNGSIK